MPIKVEIEGKGVVAEFPDGTDQSVIDAAVQRDYFSDQTPAATNPKNEAISQDYPWRRKVMEVARPVIEGAGMGIGGVVGTGAGPVGTVAGAGLGYGAGRQLSNILENAMGIRKPTPYAQTPIGSLHEAGQDVAAGATMEMGGQVMGGLGGGVINKLFGPSRNITPEAQKAMGIANREKVYLSPADIKQTKGLALTEQALNNAPLSATMVQQNKLKTIKGLTDYRNRIITQGGEGTVPDYLGRKAQMEIDDYLTQLGLAKNANLNTMRDDILNSLGSNETYQSLGKKTQEQLKTSSQQLFDKAGATYKAFYRQLPEGTTIPGNKLTQTADRLIEEQMLLPEGARDLKLMAELQGYGTKAVPNEILALPPDIQRQAMEQMGGLNNAYDPRAIQAMRSDLYKKAMTEDAAMQMNQPGYKFVSSQKGGTYKQLRSAIDEDIRNFAEQTGGDPWETYSLANKIYSEGKQIFNKAEILKAMKSNPEKVVDVLIQPNSPTSIQFARKSLGNDFFDNQLKPKLTSRLIDKSTVNGVFDPKTFGKELENYGETLNSVYPPQELAYLRDAATTGLRIKEAPLADKYFVSLVKALENKPQAIVKMIIQPKNVKTIQKAKAVLSPETWQDVERNFLSDIMTVNKPIAGQADEFISPAKFETGLFKYSDETLKAALSPDNYRAVKELGLLSKYAQGAERMAGNPSGTAQNVIAWSQGAMIWHNPITGIGMALSPPVFAQVYFSKFGRRLFVEGFKTPAGTPKGVEIATKLTALINRANKQDKTFVQPEEGIDRSQYIVGTGGSK